MGKIDKFDNKYFGTQVTHTYLENEAPIRLPEGVEIKEGSVVILERENRNITNVTLGASLKSGGQGIIYECKELPNYVIKILFDNDRTTYYKKKLRELIKFSNTNSQICWPEGVVRKNDFFIGFLMPKVVGNNLSWLEHHTSAQILERYPNFDRKTQVKIILDVLKQFEYLHSKNILVGDVKLENIMFDEKTFSVTMVDMDSVQAGEFNCTQTTPGYDAPEVIMCQGKENYNKRFDNKDYMQLKSFPYRIQQHLLFSKVDCNLK